MSKAVLMGKFKALNSYIEKKKSLKLYKRILEKSRKKRREIIETKAAINETEMRRPTESINETKH